MSETKEPQRLDAENATDFAELLRRLLEGKRFTLLENNVNGLKATEGLTLESAPAWGSPFNVAKYDDGARTMFCLNHSEGMLIISIPPRGNGGHLYPHFICFEGGISVNHFSDAGPIISWTFFVEGDDRGGRHG